MEKDEQSPLLIQDQNGITIKKILAFIIMTMEFMRKKIMTFIDNINTVFKLWDIKM